MTTPTIAAQLETALDDVTMAQNTLAIALDDAHLSALHSTYCAAIRRIADFNDQTAKSLQNLLDTLRRQPSLSKP